MTAAVRVSDLRIKRHQRGAAIHRRHAGYQIATERPEIAGLRRANGMGGIGQCREQVADYRRAYDFGMSDERTDAKSLVDNADIFELIHPRDVDDDLGAMCRKFKLDQKIGPARQNLGLSSVLAEQRYGVSDIFRRYISERLHPAYFLNATSIVHCNNRAQLPSLTKSRIEAATIDKLWRTSDCIRAVSYTHLRAHE